MSNACYHLRLDKIIFFQMIISYLGHFTTHHKTQASYGLFCFFFFFPWSQEAWASEFTMLWTILNLPADHFQFLKVWKLWPRSNTEKTISTHWTPVREELVCFQKQDQRGHTYINILKTDFWSLKLTHDT